MNGLDRIGEKVSAASFERILASMTGLCETFATELENLQHDCADDPKLHARVQAIVARSKARIIDALDQIHAEFGP